MVKIALSILLAALLCSGAILAVYLGSRGPDDPLEAPRPVNGSIASARLDRLEERLERVVARLESLEATLGEVAASRPRPREPGERDADPVSAGEPGESATEDLVASVLGGADGERFRQLVYDLVRDEREERRREQRRLARERQEEWKLLQEGPYGKFNYKVNSLGKKLDMSDLQKQRYHQLLIAYEQVSKDLLKNVDWKSRESREGYQQQKKDLLAEFQRDVVGLLAPGQAEEFDALPDWEKGMDNTPAVFINSDGIAGDATMTTTRVMVGPGDAVIDVLDEPATGAITGEPVIETRQE